jgi:hypothetical protein
MHGKDVGGIALHVLYKIIRMCISHGAFGKISIIQYELKLSGSWAATT